METEQGGETDEAKATANEDDDAQGETTGGAKKKVNEDKEDDMSIKSQS